LEVTRIYKDRYISKLYKRAFYFSYIWAILNYTKVLIMSMILGYLLMFYLINRSVFLLLFNCFFVFLAPANTDKSPVMCIDHYPPLQVILNNGEATGENVEVGKALVKKLDMDLKFTPDTPFSRCLLWLDQGKVDIMVGVLGSAQRHKNFHMLLYDDMTSKVFFIRAGSPELNTYDDLKGLKIGVSRGTKQFEKFNDGILNGHFTKVEVGDLSAAFGMLAKGRLDAVVCTDYYGIKIINENTYYGLNIQQTHYKVTSGTKTYIAISKQSELTKHIKKLREVAKKMFETRQFNEIIQTFKNEWPEFY